MNKLIVKNLEKSHKVVEEKSSHNKKKELHKKINKKLHNSVKLTKARSVNNRLREHSNKLK